MENEKEKLQKGELIFGSVADAPSEAQAQEAQSHAHHSHHGHKHHSHSSHRSHGHSRHGHKSSSHKLHRRHKKSGDKSGKNNKLIAWLKKHRHGLINCVACLVAVVCLVVMAAGFDRSNDNPQDSQMSLTEASIKIETGIYPEEVVLVNDAVRQYMAENNTLSAHDVYGIYDGYTRDLDGGLPFVFSYDVTGLPLNMQLQQAQLILTDGEKEQAYAFEAGSKKMEIYHLNTNTAYEYTLALTLNNGYMVKTGGRFKTADTPRILNIDGAANVRDFGGKQGMDGKRIRQGLLYRGSEIDGAVEEAYCLTPKGLADMKSVLGIRFDADLRSKQDHVAGKDALGKDVPHNYYNIQMYAGIFEEGQKPAVQALFSDLANKENYPIYLHCTHGADRTGTVSYLIQALVGVSEKQMEQDYGLSAFVDSYVNTQEFANFTRKLNTYAGENPQQKTETFLKSCGVTQQEIETIRDILLED